MPQIIFPLLLARSHFEFYKRQFKIHFRLFWYFFLKFSWRVKETKTFAMENGALKFWMAKNEKQFFFLIYPLRKILSSRLYRFFKGLLLLSVQENLTRSCYIVLNVSKNLHITNIYWTILLDKSSIEIFSINGLFQKHCLFGFTM